MMSTEILNCTLPGYGPVAVRVRPMAINLLVGAEQPSYSFDLAGRLIGAFVDGCNYRRALNGRVLRKWADAGARRRQWLSPDEAGRFVGQAYELAEAAACALGDPRLAVLKGWTAARLDADVREFVRIYRPVSILPPDQYLALVIQATEGCSYNRCTFCDFYRDRPFRVKGAAELAQHIRDIQAFFGPASGLRKSLFLADANALVAPMPRIREWLAVIDATDVRALHGGRAGGIFSFIDAFDVGRKSVTEWAELADRGLRRVYIGMESGDDALLQFLRKPGSVADVVNAVTTLKAAGVAVSAIVMVGVGGEQFAADHVQHTITTLKQMPLDADDIIYFSPFLDQPGSEYGALAERARLRPLSADETARQEVMLREALAAPDPDHAPRLARYDIREFVY